MPPSVTNTIIISIRWRLLNFLRTSEPVHAYALLNCINYLSDVLTPFTFFFVSSDITRVADFIRGVEV